MMGSVYLRGNTWSIQYYHHGKPFRESTGFTRKRDAVRLLREREGKIAKGTFTDTYPEKTWFKDLASDFLNDYRNNDKASLGDVDPVRSKYSADPQVSIVQQVVTVTANRSQALVEPQCFPPLRLST